MNKKLEKILENKFGRALQELETAGHKPEKVIDKALHEFLDVHYNDLIDGMKLNRI